MNARQALEKVLAESNMKASAQATLKGYLSFTNYNDNTLKVWPSNSQAAKRAGISLNTLKAQKALLIEAGWLVETGEFETHYGNEMPVLTIHQGELAAELSNKKGNTNFAKLNARRSRLALAKSRINSAIEKAAKQMNDDELDGYLEGVYQSSVALTGLTPGGINPVGGVLNLVDGGTQLSDGGDQTSVDGLTDVRTQRTKNNKDKNKGEPRAAASDSAGNTSISQIGDSSIDPKDDGVPLSEKDSPSSSIALTDECGGYQSSEASTQVDRGPKDQPTTSEPGLYSDTRVRTMKFRKDEAERKVKIAEKQKSVPKPEPAADNLTQEEREDITW
jgi:hypothetical protein